jgi:hypothetical protein
MPKYLIRGSLAHLDCTVRSEAKLTHTGKLCSAAEGL